MSFMINVQKEAVRISNRLYNQGLEKAQIRDLSGAISCLSRSVKLNKMNIQARNLLGLVYFETGEVVSALSEWVISKNIMEENNPASDYIQRLQAHRNKLDQINQSIKKYNQCLLYCHQGNEDMAVIQLKKVIAQNPKLIKAYQLLALLYMRGNNYEKARKLLKSAAVIDKTNTTTLRFLKEVDAQTGKVTSLEPRFKAKAKEGRVHESSLVYRSGNDTVIHPPAFKESSAMSSLVNLGIGLVVGIAALGFLIIPAIRQSINQEANQRIVEYSDQVASQADQISRLESSIASSESTVSSANDQIALAEEKALGYENLMKALGALEDGDYTTAANAMQSVNGDVLSVEAKEVYDSIYSQVKTTLFNQCFNDGVNAYDYKDYETAIANLLKAHEIDGTHYETLYYLAHSYYESGDTGNADIYFQKIIDTQPGTRRASDAQDYMTGTPADQTDTGGEGGTLAGPGAGDTAEGETQGDSEEDPNTEE
ncbi:MAG: tetratricopeptide repeat protein [Lachnospiraceae bacterium]|jgi:tetratricopeptide (TPR) repeat protein